MAWKHDELAADLKAYLGANTTDRMTWCDMQLGPAGSPRPDVYCLPRIYSRFMPFAYEVKISRADFQADINAGKWQKYYAFASAVVFAVPDGLISKNELPNGAGLIVRKAQVWRLAKAPKVNPLDNLPRSAWMKLLMDGVGRLGENRRHLNELVTRERAMKKALGEEVAKLVARGDRMEADIRYEIEQHEKRLAQIRQRHQDEQRRAAEKDEAAERQYARMCDLFGIPRTTPTWQFAQHIEQLVKKLNADDRVRDLLAVIEGAQRQLEAAKLRINTEAAALQGRAA